MHAATFALAALSFKKHGPERQTLNPNLPGPPHSVPQPYAMNTLPGQGPLQLCHLCHWKLCALPRIHNSRTRVYMAFRGCTQILGSLTATAAVDRLKPMKWHIQTSQWKQQNMPPLKTKLSSFKPFPAVSGQTAAGRTSFKAELIASRSHHSCAGLRSIRLPKTAQPLPLFAPTSTQTSSAGTAFFRISLANSRKVAM